MVVLNFTFPIGTALTEIRTVAMTEVSLNSRVGNAKASPNVTEVGRSRQTTFCIGSSTTIPGAASSIITTVPDAISAASAVDPRADASESNCVAKDATALD